MGKKVDKLEQMYQEFEAKYAKASEEEIKIAMLKGDSLVEQNSEEIAKLQETINTKKQLIDALEGKDEAETSPRIKSAIEAAQGEMKEAQDKMKELQTSSNRSGKMKTNLQAYMKNKDQIRQIRALKDNIDKKIPLEIAKRDESKTKMELAEASLKDANKKLADEKLTMAMSQEEYNNLLGQKAQAEKDVKEQTEIYKKAKEKIVELQTKSGKCDLAWKTLFTGKTWDDIQRRALDPKTKFVRHVDEDTKLKPTEKDTRSEEDKMKEDIGKTVEEVRRQQEEEKAKNGGKKDEKTDLPAPTSKHPRWESFKNFWKRAGNKIKEVFVGKDEAEVKKPDYSKMDDIPADKRDQFLQELRKHVDKEYGREVREQKEAQYIEQHKAKPKTNEPKPKAEKEEETR